MSLCAEFESGRTRCCAEPSAPPSTPSSQCNLRVRRSFLVPIFAKWAELVEADLGIAARALAAPPFYDEYGFNALCDVLCPHLVHVRSQITFTF